MKTIRLAQYYVDDVNLFYLNGDLIYFNMYINTDQILEKLSEQDFTNKTFEYINEEFEPEEDVFGNNFPPKNEEEFLSLVNN